MKCEGCGRPLGEDAGDCFNGRDSSDCIKEQLRQAREQLGMARNKLRLIRNIAEEGADLCTRGMARTVLERRFDLILREIDDV